MLVAQQDTVTIGDIRILGNEVTQDKYILHWAGLAVGQQISANELEGARQRLLNTELFKRVNLAANTSDDNESASLTIELQEKTYTLVVPRLGRNGDGDIKTGIRLQMDNLNGADRTLMLSLEAEDKADGDQEEEVKFSYKMPMFGAPYNLRGSLAFRETATSEDGFDNVEERIFLEFSVGRVYPLAKYERDLEVIAGLRVEDRSYQQAYPESVDAAEAGVYNRLVLGIEYDKVDKLPYRRAGHIYLAEFEQGIEWLASDYRSQLLILEMRGYRPMNRWDNINYRLELGVARNSPFDYPVFGLGGASSLRGLESFDGRGDARFFTNMEYVFGYARYPSIRSSLFIDAGNVYDSIDDVELTDLRFTVGAGIRWKLESFVKTDLFLDYGYDVDTADNKLYGGTRLAF